MLLSYVLSYVIFNNICCFHMCPTYVVFICVVTCCFHMCCHMLLAYVSCCCHMCCNMLLAYVSNNCCIANRCSVGCVRFALHTGTLNPNYSMHACIHAHVLSHTHAYVCVCVCMCVCMYMHVCMYVCLNVCLYVCMCVFIPVSLDTHFRRATRHGAGLFWALFPF